MYLMNTWYCAGWSTDLGDAPIGRKMLDKVLVLYRGTDGKPIAMDGVCPHRFAPLAQGKVQGDNIECPYHGLVYDKQGGCIVNPHGDGFIPPRAKLESYPIVEKNGVLWVWLGNGEADPGQIIDTDWLIDDKYDAVAGNLYVRANYQMILDNLLDLTHAPYLHTDTIGGDPELSIGAQMEYDFRIEDGPTIHSDYLVKNMGPTPYLEPLWGKRIGDFRAEMSWSPASNLELDIRMSPPGADKTEGIHLPSFHFLVPETETTTRYFYAMARNVEVDNEAETQRMAEFARCAFEDEDEPMIKACQDNMGSIDLFANDPAILPSDVAGVQARKKLANLIAAESEQAINSAAN